MFSLIIVLQILLLCGIEANFLDLQIGGNAFEPSFKSHIQKPKNHSLNINSCSSQLQNVPNQVEVSLNGVKGTKGSDGTPKRRSDSMNRKLIFLGKQLDNLKNQLREERNKRVYYETKIDELNNEQRILNRKLLAANETLNEEEENVKIKELELEKCKSNFNDHSVTEAEKEYKKWLINKILKIYAESATKWTDKLRARIKETLELFDEKILYLSFHSALGELTIVEY